VFLRFLSVAVVAVLFISCSEYGNKTIREEITIVNNHGEEGVKDIYLPDTIYFSGERVPLEKSYVREAVQKELMVNAYRHSKALLLIKKQPRWQPLIDSILKGYNVPEDFFYLAVTESYLSNRARSGVGASGMWQFMPSTAKEYGLQMTKDYDMRRNPWLATIAACNYLNKSYTKFENWTLTAASYNRGRRGISQALDKQKVSCFYDLYLNQETTRYIYRIISFKLILNYPEKYGFQINEEEKYAPYEYQEKQLTSTVNSLVDYALSNQTTYKELRLLNPWLNNSSSFRLKISKGGTLILRVPKNEKAIEE